MGLYRDITENSKFKVLYRFLDKRAAQCCNDPHSQPSDHDKLPVIAISKVTKNWRQEHKATDKNCKYVNTGLMAKIHYTSKVWYIYVFERRLLYSSRPSVIFWNRIAIWNNWLLFEHILTCNLFLWWQSWIFSIITPVFSVIWSFRNQSNMLIRCSRKHVLLSLILKTVVLLNILLWKLWHF